MDGQGSVWSGARWGQWALEGRAGQGRAAGAPAAGAEGRESKFVEVGMSGSLFTVLSDEGKTEQNLGWRNEVPGR